MKRYLPKNVLKKLHQLASPSLIEQMSIRFVTNRRLKKNIKFFVKQSKIHVELPEVINHQSDEVKNVIKEFVIKRLTNKPVSNSLFEEIRKLSEPQIGDLKQELEFYQLKLNKSLKRSIKHHIIDNKTIIEVPEAIYNKGEIALSIISKYLSCRKLKKQIPSNLQSEFNSLFERRISIQGYTDNSIHDIQKIYDELNIDYFSGVCNIDAIKWTSRASKRILGKYYQQEKTIVVSRILNNIKVPRYVISHIIHHEMCHQLFPPIISGKRRFDHHKTFKKNESQHVDFIRANKWITKNFQIILASYKK